VTDELERLRRYIDEMERDVNDDNGDKDGPTKK